MYDMHVPVAGSSVPASRSPVPATGTCTLGFQVFTKCKVYG